MKTIRKYFSTMEAAWTFAWCLNKEFFQVVNYGKDYHNADNPYYIDYVTK